MRSRSPPEDNTAPAASLTTPPSPQLGATTSTFVVTYTDATGVNQADIDHNDVTVTPEGGGTPLEVVGADAVPSDGGRTMTVTYTFNAPGRTWDAGDNGTQYLIDLVAGEVRDTSAAQNAVTATNLGNFTSNV